MQRLRFSLLTMLLVTAAFAFGTAAWTRVTRPRPYAGSGHDLSFNSHGILYHGRLDVGGRFYITPRERDAQPSWETWADNPPLTARDALLIVDRFSRTRFDDAERDAWMLESLTLKPLDIDKGKWVWVATFVVPETPNTMGRLPFYVMMDGTVVNPESYPES